MPLILDIIILVLLVVFTALGAHRGFVLTLCGLVAVIVAFVGGNILADTLSPKLADALQPRMEAVIQEALEEKALEVSAQDGLGVTDALAALRDKGGLYEWAADGLEDTLKSTPGISESIAHQAAVAASALTGQLAHGLLFLLGFLAVLILWAILSHALDLVARLPGLSSLNYTLGAVIGLLKGLIIVWLAVWVLCTLTGFISKETAEQTHLFLFLTQHGPLDLLSLGRLAHS